MKQSTQTEDSGRNCSSTLSHALILCTKDRPRCVAECLAQVLTSSELPQNLIVVDSSGDELTRGVVDSMEADFARMGCPVVYTQSKPGLTAQRNIGLDLVNGDVAHFIDDDSLVEHEYFSEILKIFVDLGTTVAGVGGIQSNVVTGRPRLIRRLFFLSASPGRVSKAACNSLVSSKTKDATPAEWLSGCAMSYWTELARGERFDESLEGYALGEDLEFCLRMAGHGTLVVQPSAKVVHGRSDHNRLDLRRFWCGDVVNRWYFVQKHHSRFSRVAYAWSIIGLVCIGFAKTTLGRFDEGRNELLGIRDGLLKVWPFSSAGRE